MRVIWGIRKCIWSSFNRSNSFLHRVMRGLRAKMMTKYLSHLMLIRKLYNSWKEGRDGSRTKKLSRINESSSLGMKRKKSVDFLTFQSQCFRRKRKLLRKNMSVNTSKKVKSFKILSVVDSNTKTSNKCISISSKISLATKLKSS